MASQRGRDSVEKRSQESGSCSLEVRPEDLLVAVDLDWLQIHDDRAVKKIAAGDEFLDPVQDRRPCDMDDRFLEVAVQLPR